MLVDINLLPKKERDRPAFVIAAIGLLLLAIVLWAVLFFMAESQQAKQNDLLLESSEIAMQQSLIREQLEARVGLNEEQQLQKTVDWAESYEYDTIPLLNDLVSKLPQRGFFDSFTYTGTDAASLVLQFDTSREAAYYLAQLKESDLLASASLVSISTEELESVEEEGVVSLDPAFINNPRYFAEYQLVFVDDRIPAEGEAEIGEVPVEEVPAEEDNVEVEVEVEVTEDPALEDSEGDGQ